MFVFNKEPVSTKTLIGNDMWPYLKMFWCISQFLFHQWTTKQIRILTIIYVFVLYFKISRLNMRAMLTVTVLTMCSILCFGQVGNSRIMVLKLRSSSIAVRFFQIVAAHQTYSCKGNSHCIHPCLAPIMATDLILPKKLQVLNAISISQSTHFPLSPCMLILYLPISM